MNKIYLSIIVLLTIIPATLLAQGGQDLSPIDFSVNLKARDIQLVDVRTPGEFNEGHLKNAENIDYQDRKFMQEISTLDKNKPTYIYCRSGGRSGNAMEDMLEAGFTKVYNMDGGILAWKEAKLPVTKSLGAGGSMSYKEYKALVNQDTPVLVDFTATWCGPCKILKPSLVRLANKYPEDIKVVYIDVDENRELSNKLSIRAMPTLHLYKKGKLSKKHTGLISYQELKRFIR